MKGRTLIVIMSIQWLAITAMGYMLLLLWQSSASMRQDIDAAGGNSVAWEQEAEQIRSRIDALEPGLTRLQQHQQNQNTRLDQISTAVDSISREVKGVSELLALLQQNQQPTPDLQPVLERLRRLENSIESSERSLPAWMNNITIQLRPSGPMVRVADREMLVGDTRDGWKMISIDAPQQLVVFQHGDVLKTLKVQ